MQYMTIVMRLLEERPKLHERLRRERKLLMRTKDYALELKASHERFKQTLPDNEAADLALQELLERLPPESDAV